METLTNSEWIRQFEADLKRRFPDRSTAKHYVSDLRIFTQYHPGPLTEVTTQDIDAFVDDQRARGLAPATVKRRAATLKTFFDFLAQELGESGRPNPVCMRRHAGRQPRHLPRDLSDAEVEHLLEAVGKKSRRDLAMIALMLYAGLRVSEVQGLRGADITVPEDPPDLDPPAGDGQRAQGTRGLPVSGRLCALGSVPPQAGAERSAAARVP